MKKKLIYAGEKGNVYRLRFTVTAGKDKQTSTTPEVKL